MLAEAGNLQHQAVMPGDAPGAADGDILRRRPHMESLDLAPDATQRDVIMPVAGRRHHSSPHGGNVVPCATLRIRHRNRQETTVPTAWAQVSFRLLPSVRPALGNGNNWFQPKQVRRGYGWGGK